MKKLKSKFFIIFILLVIVPLISIGLYFTNLYRRNIEKRYFAEQRNILISLKNEILDKHIEDMEKVLYSLSQNKDLYKIFDDPAIMDDQLGQWDLLRSVFPERAWIYYGNRDNIIVTSPYWQAPPEYNLLERPWYLSGKNSEVVKWTKPYLEYVNQDMVLTASLGIKNRDGEYEGVLAIDTPAETFLSLLKDAAIGRDSKLLAVIESGDAIFLNNSESIESINGTELINSGEYITLSSEEYHVERLSLDKIGFKLVSLIPLSSINKEIREVVIVLHIVIAIGIILAVFAGLYVSKYILNNVLKSNSLIERVVNKEYDNLEFKKSDEFEILNRNIKKLAERIKKQLSDLNTLNNSLNNSLIKERKLTDIKTAVIHLLSQNSASPLTMLYYLTSELLEEDEKNETYKLLHSTVKNIKSINENIMTYLKLDDDIDYTDNEINICELTDIIVNNYKLLCKSRCIDFNITSKDEITITGSYFIVKFILENLINNSVKFTKDSGSIKIDIKKEVNRVLWIIEDEGPGFSPEDREKLYGKFQTLSAKPQNMEISTGLGLYLVKTLSSHIGADINLDNNSDSGAKFIISFKV